MAQLRWQSPRTADPHGPSFSLPRGALLLIGALAFAASVGEGAMADWGAVFLTDPTGASEARAALGYVVFSAAMVTTRLSGPVIISRLGAVGTARASGVIAAVGAVVLSQGLASALVRFILLGMGYANWHSRARQPNPASLKAGPSRRERRWAMAECYSARPSSA
ncbi:MFS transporter [Thioclava sp. BHET1]|nr:MFS transporter [Thioclava sp. BHET1]